MKNRRWLIAAVCFLTGVGFACAQEAKPQGAPATDNTQKSETDPRKLAAARELANVFGIADSYKSTFDATGKTVLSLITRDNPGQDERAQKVMSDVYSRVLAAHMDQLVNANATVYMNTYSYDELQQMIAFFKLPAGQKLLRTFRQTMNQSAISSESVIVPAEKESIQKLVEELKKNGMKVSQETEKFTQDYIDTLDKQQSASAQGQQCLAVKKQ